MSVAESKNFYFYSRVSLSHRCTCEVLAKTCEKSILERMIDERRRSSSIHGINFPLQTPTDDTGYFLPLRHVYFSRRTVSLRIRRRQMEGNMTILRSLHSYIVIIVWFFIVVLFWHVFRSVLFAISVNTTHQLPDFLNSIRRQPVCGNTEVSMTTWFRATKWIFFIQQCVKMY